VEVTLAVSYFLLNCFELCFVVSGAAKTPRRHAGITTKQIMSIGAAGRMFTDIGFEEAVGNFAI
jgi:hypothetical protein